jgi:hypothetical protein
MWDSGKKLLSRSPILVWENGSRSKDALSAVEPS